jgi:hypothetical protein
MNVKTNVKIISEPINQHAPTCRFPNTRNSLPAHRLQRGSLDVGLLKHPKKLTLSQKTKNDKRPGLTYPRHATALPRFQPTLASFRPTTERPPRPARLPALNAPLALQGSAKPACLTAANHSRETSYILQPPKQIFPGERFHCPPLTPLLQPPPSLREIAEGISATYKALVVRQHAEHNTAHAADHRLLLAVLLYVPLLGARPRCIGSLLLITKKRFAPTTSQVARGFLFSGFRVSASLSPVKPVNLKPETL